MNVKKILYTVLAAWIALYLFGIIGFLIEDAQGHEGEHAEGIHHLEKGETTPPVTRSETCPGQNKVLLYHDMSRYGMDDVCTTLWEEHGKMHIIISYPDPDGVCECQGYIWLNNDSQEGE